MVACAYNRVWYVPPYASRWRNRVDSLSRRLDPLPARNVGNRWSRDDLVRSAAPSGPRDDRLRSTNGPFGRLRARATRVLALKISHVIINPPRAIMGRIYFIEAPWLSEKHQSPTRSFTILLHLWLKSLGHIMRSDARLEKRGVNRSSI